MDVSPQNEQPNSMDSGRAAQHHTVCHLSFTDICANKTIWRTDKIEMYTHTIPLLGLCGKLIGLSFCEFGSLREWNMFMIEFFTQVKKIHTKNETEIVETFKK